MEKDMSKSTIALFVGGIVLAIIAFKVVEETNDGPLENAAEDLEDAAEEISNDLQ